MTTRGHLSFDSLLSVSGAAHLPVPRSRFSFDGEGREFSNFCDSLFSASLICVSDPD